MLAVMGIVASRNPHNAAIEFAAAISRSQVASRSDRFPLVKPTSSSEHLRVHARLDLPAVSVFSLDELL